MRRKAAKEAEQYLSITKSTILNSKKMIAYRCSESNSSRKVNATSLKEHPEDDGKVRDFVYGPFLLSSSLPYRL
jgi:hypothetical protein